MELTEAVHRRHMTRNFTGAPLNRAVVDGLLSDALAAPSAGNTQGRDLVVLEGRTETGRFWAATTDEAWRARSRRFEGLSRAPVVVLPFSDPTSYAERYREPDKAGDREAGDREAGDREAGDREAGDREAGDREAGDREVDWVVPFWHVDAGFVVMTLLLGAVDRGIGAAFLGNFRGEARLREVLGVPDHMRWLGAVLLGEPAHPDRPSTSAARPRRTVADSVHRSTW